ncbi:protein FATTY ACID EXPORT 4, chloroplastic [Magnolia sinica]|uniref:protein FATTY ACID EXPORT 4, chloroplastic n=1 Tax=Magnolia sinica TaxID=86752 RepID=UPI00265ABDC4|nr:protein FATTY ACID EXPORT 4, chloroplastic [Magnolia sinica]
MSLFLSTPSALLIYHNKTLGIRTHTVSTTATTTKKIRVVKPHIPRFTAQIADLAPAASAVYGTLLLGGGLFAYTRSKSKGSLLGGVSGAILMATAYFLMQVPETKDLGDALGFGSAFIFSSVFGIRLAATRKLIPAGPLLGLSVCALAVFISAYLQDRI